MIRKWDSYCNIVDSIVVEIEIEIVLEIEIEIEFAISDKDDIANKDN